MATMTLRGIDESIANALKKQAKNEWTSVNALTLRILREKLGLEKKKRSTTYHDLDSLAGTWSAKEAAEFEQATAVFEKIDEAMWK